jgi:hypothetical protein
MSHPVFDLSCLAMSLVATGAAWWQWRRLRQFERVADAVLQAEDIARRACESAKAWRSVALQSVPRTPKPVVTICAPEFHAPRVWAERVSSPPDLPSPSKRA